MMKLNRQAVHKRGYGRVALYQRGDRYIDIWVRNENGTKIIKFEQHRRAALPGLEEFMDEVERRMEADAKPKRRRRPSRLGSLGKLKRQEDEAADEPASGHRAAG